MRGSFRLFTLLGIPVLVHWTFFILLVWIVGTAIVRGAGASEAAVSGLQVLALFACVVLHEFGHAIAARRYGIGTRDITLLPIGGVARLERMPEKPVQEIVVAIAGPMVNVVIALGLFLIVGAPSLVGFNPESILSAQAGGALSFLYSLMIVNLFLVAFNLIPAFPMDGGRVLRAVLALFMEHHVATRVAATVGQACAVGFAIWGLFGNPFLILIAVFIWMGAQAEAQVAETRSVFRGRAAREAMATNFRVLHEGATLEEAAGVLLSGTQADFPVVSADRLVGVALRTDIVNAIRERGPGAALAEIVRRDWPTVEENEPLERVVDRMREVGAPIVPVLRRGALVGIVTADHLAELLAIRSRVRGQWGRVGAASPQAR